MTVGNNDDISPKQEDMHEHEESHSQQMMSVLQW